MDRNDFKHKVCHKVRFSEVDMLGVVNNVEYIEYFENARLEYIKDAGLMPPKGLFSDGRLYFMVRNEANYYDVSGFGDELVIYTRISFVKNSSYGFEHIIENAATGKLIADGAGVVVHVDPKTRKSTPIDDETISKILRFEPTVKIIKE
jgi:acyl-CoA thioester hydrolase